MKKQDTAPAQGGIREAQLQSIKISTARQYRVMRALYSGPHSREEIDRIAGASNGPEVVRQLRVLGWEIPCELVPHIDRDGLRGRHGVYCLAPADRKRLQDWLAQPKVPSKGKAA